jgi:lipoyl(octanoyl) transferase
MAQGVFIDGLVPYATALQWQQRLHAARLGGDIPDTVLFLQHAPVVTAGRRARLNHLLTPPDLLRSRGIDFYVASRGGDVTFHGPGQWVMYPILKLGDREADTHGHLWNLEEIAIRTAADFGVPAWRVGGMSGAWAAAGKFAAIGFAVKRWITMHGMSFNVRVDLSGFSTIVPCGLVGTTVSSLAVELGARCPAESAVRERLAFHFQNVCGRPLKRLNWIFPGKPPPELGERFASSD